MTGLSSSFFASSGLAAGLGYTHQDTVRTNGYEKYLCDEENKEIIFFDVVIGESL